MEKRIALLEARLESVEKEIGSIRALLKLDVRNGETADTADDATRFEHAVKELGLPGEKVAIYRVRAHLSWDANQFDEVLESLVDQGRVVLHEEGAESLSLKQIGDSYQGESGELYGCVSLA